MCKGNRKDVKASLPITQIKSGFNRIGITDNAKYMCPLNRFFRSVFGVASF